MIEGWEADNLSRGLGIDNLPNLHNQENNLAQVSSVAMCLERPEQESRSQARQINSDVARCRSEHAGWASKVPVLNHGSASSDAGVRRTITLGLVGGSGLPRIRIGDFEAPSAPLERGIKIPIVPKAGCGLISTITHNIGRIDQTLAITNQNTTTTATYKPAMSTDAFRRVGRGGAGNYYTKQDIQDAEKATDLEAQTNPSLSPSRTQTNTTVSGSGGGASITHARTGRGGAGNFNFSVPSSSSHNKNSSSSKSSPETGGKQNDDGRDEEAELAAERSRAAAAVAASLAAKSRTGGLSGRGGAGNWNAGSNGNGGDEVEKGKEKERMVEELEMKVLKEVEAVLAVPGRTYHGQGLGQKE